MNDADKNTSAFFVILISTLFVLGFSAQVLEICSQKSSPFFFYSGYTLSHQSASAGLLFRDKASLSVALCRRRCGRDECWWCVCLRIVRGNFASVLSDGLGVREALGG